jgi:hypothetical protein
VVAAAAAEEEPAKEVAAVAQEETVKKEQQQQQRQQQQDIPGSLLTSMPCSIGCGVRLGRKEMAWGPSCTFRKKPTPCPVPCL